MINMSYCRFHNTNMAVCECIDALTENEALNADERIACINLFNNVINYLEDEGVIESDPDAFDEWAESIESK